MQKLVGGGKRIKKGDFSDPGEGWGGLLKGGPEKGIKNPRKLLEAVEEKQSTAANEKSQGPVWQSGT